MKGQVKQVFISKDDLFRKINQRIKRVMRSSQDFVKCLEQEQMKHEEENERKNKVVQEIIDEIRLFMKTQEQILNDEGR